MGRPWGLRTEAEETEQRKRIPPEGRCGGVRVPLARGGEASGLR